MVAYPLLAVLIFARPRIAASPKAIAGFDRSLERGDITMRVCDCVLRVNRNGKNVSWPLEVNAVCHLNARWPELIEVD